MAVDYLPKDLTTNIYQANSLVVIRANDIFSGGSSPAGCSSQERPLPHRPPGRLHLTITVEKSFFLAKAEIRRRYGQFEDILRALDDKEGGIKNFALGHKTFGPQVEFGDFARFSSGCLAKKERQSNHLH